MRPWIPAFALALPLVGCRLTSARVDLPRPYEEHGIQVTVDRVLRWGAHTKGVAGTATNLTPEPVSCTLTFQGLDGVMQEVGIARAHTGRLAPGESWAYKATFASADVELSMVLPHGVRVRPVD